eukprot:TRINITY_DN9036_c0_g1_i6.p1 TRINITY_DN9036_c0_g1~~TRINITY_DN9036_c0_g1_i6.p1  ORF type:complete len:145 (+),score=31.74 TRINITY_DN9036_c0_g1_i6:61-435(+)
MCIRDRYNPITVKGRIALMSGLLESYNMRQAVSRLSLGVTIVHSMKNSLVKITHTDDLSRIKNQSILELLSATGSMQDEARKRECFYVEGGHCVIEDNLKEFNNILRQFVSKQASFDDTQEVES